jgi:hypothetical protein
MKMAPIIATTGPQCHRRSSRDLDAPARPVRGVTV